MARSKSDLPSFNIVIREYDRALAMARLDASQMMLIQAYRELSWTSAKIDESPRAYPFTINLTALAKAKGFPRTVVTKAHGRLLDARLVIGDRENGFRINKRFREWLAPHSLTDRQIEEAERANFEAVTPYGRSIRGRLEYAKNSVVNDTGCVVDDTPWTGVGVSSTTQQIVSSTTHPHIKDAPASERVKREKERERSAAAGLFSESSGTHTPNAAPSAGPSEVASKLDALILEHWPAATPVHLRRIVRENLDAGRTPAEVEQAVAEAASRDVDVNGLVEYVAKVIASMSRKRRRPRPKPLERTPSPPAVGLTPAEIEERKLFEPSSPGTRKLKVS